MKLVFDTSVWVDHLRAGALDDVIPRLRGRFALYFDSISAAELRAGCRTKRERQVVARLLKPFEGAHRVLHPLEADLTRAAAALSRLREAGRTLKNPGGALLDAMIASVCCRGGALLVTSNVSDFRLLALELPLEVESFSAFQERLSTLRS